MLMNSLTEKCETWVTWEPFMDSDLRCRFYYSTWTEKGRA